MAMQHQQKSKDIRKAYEQNEAVPELEAQIRKSKALDWLIHNVEFVDEAGTAIDRDALLGHSHDEDGNHVDDEADDELDQQIEIIDGRPTSTESEEESES
jgi:trigger factor